MTQKCNSCFKGFDGRNGNGYQPCNCKTKSKIDNTDLNNLLQKAIEAKPEFVEPPPLIPWNDTGLKVIHPWFYRASIYFAIGVMVGITGCLYATSHIS